ncbi:DUF3592 domain-containing protein [Pseudogracilibacillus sp. SE30717A]|uniref:DUF3592 domain-containing protein n=1 Tax=Pseudogracilibacillus sp. SE30717A TaxID=3098293 RepID=UPI00300E470F
MIVIFAIIFLIGLVFLFIGMKQRLRWTGLKATEGVIVKRETDINFSDLFSNLTKEEIQEQQADHPDEYPSFQYKVEGKSYEKRSMMSIKPGFKPGKKVTVYYDPLQPEKAYLKNITVTGTLFLLGAIFVFVVDALLYFIVSTI